MTELEEKAQQLPHLPWSLTGVMTPWSLQSTDSGKSSSLISFLLFGVNLVLAKARVLGRPLAYEATNSSLYIEIIEMLTNFIAKNYFERSANLVTPIRQLWPSELCCSIFSKFFMKCPNLICSSSRLS